MGGKTRAQTEEAGLRVLYFGTYREEYSRNQIMIEGLRCAGARVETCHAPLWQGIEDRVQAASGGWRSLGFMGRVMGAYARLLRRYLQVTDFDVMVVGYPGQFDVFVARLLCWLRRKPLAWDVFMSIYLIAIERGLEQRSRLTIGLLKRLERLALRLPDLLIQDTPQYVAWLAETHGIASSRFGLVPTGADDRVHHPLPSTSANAPVFRAVYYGSFIPNHGVQAIIEAAHLLADDSSLRVDLIGDGPEKPAAESLAQQLGLRNVTFYDWMSKEALAAHVATADVCLGAFGTTPQSLMTVQNKIYECLAMAKPVITGDSAAMRQDFRHGEHLYLCERASGESLARAIRTLRNDPGLRQRLAANGLAIFTAHFSLATLGQRFYHHLKTLVEAQK